MKVFASMFTDRGIVLLEHVSADSAGYRLVVEQRRDCMVVVKAGGGREEVLYERLDEDALNIIVEEHLFHEENPVASGAEILLHHTLEEVVACLDGEDWAFNRAADRIAKAAAVNWRARYEAMAEVWDDTVVEAPVGSPRGSELQVACATLEHKAEGQGVALSRMLTLALVDHIVTGRLNIGQALSVARRATLDQLLGYEAVVAVGVGSRH